MADNLVNKTFTYPDGSTRKVTVPAGATDEQIIEASIKAGIWTPPKEEKGFGDYVKDVGQGIISGYNRASQELAEVTGMRAGFQWLDDKIEDLTGIDLTGIDFSVNIDRPETMVGRGAEALSQFFTGYGVAAATGGGTAAAAGAPQAFAQLSRAGQWGYRMFLGAFADSTAFDPNEDTAAEVLRDVGIIDKDGVIAKYLANDEDDTELTKRAKNALEGAIAGAAVDAAFLGIRGMRNLFSRNKALKAIRESIESADVERGVVNTVEDVARPRVTEPSPIPDRFNDVVPDERTVDLIRGNAYGVPEGDKIVNMSTKSVDVKGDPIDLFDLDNTDLTFLQRLADDYDIKPDRVTIEETYKTLRSMGLSTREIVERNKKYKGFAKQVAAVREHLVTNQERLKTLARNAEIGGVEDIAALQKEIARQASLLEIAVRNSHEAGLALRLHRETSKAASESVEQLQEILSKYGDETSFKELAAHIQNIEGVDDLIKAANAWFKEPSPIDAFNEYLINWGYLSSPVTHATNILSNAAYNLENMLERGIAGAMSPLYKGADKVRMREALAYSSGLFTGAKDATIAMLKTLGRDDALLRYGNKEWVDAVGRIELRAHKAFSGRTLGKLVPESVKRVTGDTVNRATSKTADFVGEWGIRAPGRLLYAGDSFFKTLGVRQNLGAIATRKAYKELSDGVITKGMLKERVAQLMSDPSQEMLKEAMEGARYLTFTKQLGTHGRALQLLANHPLLKPIIPFVRTPINLLKAAGERNPLAVLNPNIRREILSGSREGQLALAKIIAGTGWIAGAAYLVLEGRLTGSVPSDPELRDNFYAAGMQPYSAKVGNEWYSYARFEPLSTLLGVTADIVTLTQDGYLTSQEAENLSAAVVNSAARNILDKSYLHSFGTFFQAMDDPERYGGRFVSQLLATAARPNIVNQIARVQDPVLRDTRVDDEEMASVKRILAEIKNRTPRESQELPARRDLWGEVIGFEGAAGPDILSPVFKSTITDDPVRQWMFTNKIEIAKPERQIMGVELTAREYEAYSAIAGKMAHEQVSQMMANPSFRNAPLGMQERLVRQAVTRSRRIAQLQLMPYIQERLKQYKVDELKKLAE